jgi:hypothetical protein
MEKREKEFQKSSEDFLKQVTKISNKGQFATDADFHKCKKMFNKSETNFNNLASDFDNIMDIHNDELEQISTIMFRGSYSDEVSDTEVEEEVARVMAEVDMEQRARALAYVWPSVPTH